MLLSLDVHYTDTNATCACVVFNDWTNQSSSNQFTVIVEDVAPYQPGEFYKRELPCLLKAIEQLDQHPDTIIIDGYVWLDDQNRKGLGAYLYEALSQDVPVIGVAKNAFGDASAGTAIYRGRSNNPLWITAVGIDLENAAAHIKSMHGPYRIPTLLKLADQLCRQE